MIEKTLDTIALPITEPEYREMEELSYSTLSTYERTGFDGLDHLFDRKETPSLTFGSCVDAIITGGKEEFDSLFFVADIPNLGDKELLIVKNLFNNYSANCAGLSAVPREDILLSANQFEFQKNWKDDTRVKVLIERCSGYYNLMYLADNRTIVSSETYNDVLNAVSALKTSAATSGYFADNQPEAPVQRYYQLKFRANLRLNENAPIVGYRCMADLLVVDYEDKIIIPVDLKTSSKQEWNFFKSFIEWNYACQARLYWRIIRANLNKDPYFKDFKLLDYRFIVVNKKTLTPLVWEFKDTQKVGELTYGKNKQIIIRDPLVIGAELRQYLDSRPAVPAGIQTDGLNDLEKYLKDL